MKDNLIRIFILVVFLFVIGLFFGIIYEKQNEDFYSQDKKSENSLVDQKTFETRTIEIDDPYVKFDVKYPFFLFQSDEFNDSIKKELETNIEDHRISSRENWKARYETSTKEEKVNQYPSQEEKFYFFSDFEIVQSNDSYISFVLRYGGFSGGAHGYELKKSYAYDLKNAKVIELADLFNGNQNYLNKISTETRAILKEKILKDLNEQDLMDDEKERNEYINGILELVDEGTKEEGNNFSVFTFTPDKIKIYFAQYQVGPYSMGAPEVEISR